MPVANLDAVGKAYCANTLSNIKLAAAHDISEGVIRKWAKKYGWVRGEPYVPPAAPLPPVPKALLRREPAPAPAPVPPPADTFPPMPAEPLRTTPATTTNAELTDDLIRRMLNELDAVTCHIDELEELIEAETAGDRDGRRRAGMMKAVSLATRSNTLRLLLAAQVEANKKPEKGKKEQKAEAAKGAATGRFAPSVAPLRGITGGKT